MGQISIKIFTLQNRFFPIVHYALKDNGILLLGKSESISTASVLIIDEIGYFNMSKEDAENFD